MSGAVVFRHVPNRVVKGLELGAVRRFLVESRFDCRSILRYFGLPSCMWVIFRHARPPDVDFTERMSCEPFLVIGGEVVEACVTALAWRKRRIVH